MHVRRRALALAVIAILLATGLAQSAPSRVEVVARGPQAQQPDTAAGDEDTSRPGTQVRPRAGAAHGFPADIIVYDDNGHNDVRSANITVLLADNVTVHKATVEASKLSGSAKRATWRATVTMSSDDPPGEYILRAAALDRDAAVTYAWTNFTYEPLAALTIGRNNLSLSAEGSSGLEPGEDTSGSPLRVNVTNGGNVPVNITVSGTALTNATFGASLPASSLQASRSSAMTSAVTLSSATQTLPGDPVAANATAPLHFSVAVPEGLRPGVYTGDLTLGAVAAS